MTKRTRLNVTEDALCAIRETQQWITMFVDPTLFKGHRYKQCSPSQAIMYLAFLHSMGKNAEEAWETWMLETAESR